MQTLTQHQAPNLSTSTVPGVAVQRDSLLGVAAVLAVALAFPLAGGTLELGEFVGGVVQLVGCWAVGTLVLRFVPATRGLTELTRIGVAMLLGTCLLYPLTSQPFGISARWVIGATCVIATALAVRQRALGAHLLGRREVALLVAAVVCATAMSVGNGDLTRSLVRLPVVVASPDDADAPYFTSLVATMRGGTIKSAVFEQGTPLSYSVIAALAPSTFAAASGAPSHVALWGVWMPLLKVLGVLLIVECVRRLLCLRQASSGIAWVSAAVLFFLLQPLHPGYVLKLQPENFVWGGPGFLWGGLNLPTTAGIVWASLALVIALPSRGASKLTRPDLALFALTLGSLSAVKVTLWVATTAILGVSALGRARRGDYFVLIGTAMSIPIAVVSYGWAYGGDGRSPEITFGYLPEYFASMAGIPATAERAALLGIGIAAALFLVWAGIRLVTAAALVRLPDEPWRMSIRRELVVGCVVALVVGALLASFLRIPVRDLQGNVVGDKNYDLLQFPRAAFLFVSILGVTGAIAWAAAPSRSRFQRVTVRTIVAVWALLGLTGLLARSARLAPLIDDPWLPEARRELYELSPRLIAINPGPTSGLYLAASDVGSFWVSQILFNMSRRHAYRWVVFDSLLTGNAAARSLACRTVLREGVDAVVALPREIEAVGRFAKECGFVQHPGRRWVWVRSVGGGSART